MTCRISANLITLNEERNIAGCLQTLTWADEITVMDGGSHDRTRDIALDYTDRVFTHPFDDYASQRNRAIEHARGEWIFSIDADERVPARLAAEIGRETRLAPARCDAFWVSISSRIFGRRFRYSGTQGEQKLRLFRRSRGRWRGAVHETVQVKGQTRHLRHAIEHRSTPDLRTYLRKLNRYSHLEAERMCSIGRRPAPWRPWLLPAWTFAKLYVGKLGMLDGPEGFCFCALSAWEKWVTYEKFLAMRRTSPSLPAGFSSAVPPVKEERRESAHIAA